MNLNAINPHLLLRILIRFYIVADRSATYYNRSQTYLEETIWQFRK